MMKEQDITSDIILTLGVCMEQLRGRKSQSDCNRTMIKRTRTREFRTHPITHLMSLTLEKKE